MKKNYTHIVKVLDRSGSMYSILNATIEGFNTFLKTQQESEGEATLTLVQFDNEIETVHNAVNINTVEPLTDKTFIPRGGTALYDAICQTINTTGDFLNSKSKANRPEKVIFVILTDGGENSSTEFDYAKVNALISHQTNKYNWEFVFIGANQDAMATARGLGINVNNAITFEAHAAGMGSSMSMLSRKLVDYRTGKAADMSYTSAERAEQDEANKA